MGESNVAQVGILKVSVCQDSISNTGISAWGETQSSAAILRGGITDSRIFFEQGVKASSVISTEIGTSKIDFTKIGTIQVDPSQHGIAEIDAMKIDSSKVSFTSSITLQQFLSSHNFDLQNRTVTLWTEFLQSPTPFNLKVEITDLPTGQLAEGTITGYDTTGRPNSGTLTIDSNGNGQGWFIDTTPGNNSEFDKQLSETAYRATTRSSIELIV
jgi:hypothetical protein